MKGSAQSIQTNKLLPDQPLKPFAGWPKEESNQVQALRSIAAAMEQELAYTKERDEKLTQLEADRKNAVIERVKASPLGKIGLAGLGKIASGLNLQNLVLPKETLEDLRERKNRINHEYVWAEEKMMEDLHLKAPSGVWGDVIDETFRDWKKERRDQANLNHAIADLRKNRESKDVLKGGIWLPGSMSELDLERLHNSFKREGRMPTGKSIWEMMQARIDKAGLKVSILELSKPIAEKGTNQDTEQTTDI